MIVGITPAKLKEFPFFKIKQPQVITMSPWVLVSPSPDARFILGLPTSSYSHEDVSYHYQYMVVS